MTGGEVAGTGREQVVGDRHVAGPATVPRSAWRQRCRTRSSQTYGDRQQPAQASVGDPIAGGEGTDVRSDHRRRHRLVVIGDVTDGPGNGEHCFVADVDDRRTLDQRAHLLDGVASPNEAATAIPYMAW